MSLPYDCGHSVPIEDEPQHHLVIVNEYVRAFAVEIAPHSRTLCHRHPHDYFLYVANGAEIVSAARDEEPKQLNYATGECELSEAGLVHVVENLSGAPFRNVVVELLPRATELRRGVGPAVRAGEAVIKRVLGADLGDVLSVDLSAGGELEIAGPAVLAAPFGPVLIKELEDYDIPLNDFRKLMWVCAPRNVGIRNAGERRTRIVVVQLGIDS